MEKLDIQDNGGEGRVHLNNARPDFCEALSGKVVCGKLGQTNCVDCQE